MASSDKETGRGKLLIVDDVETNRMVLEEIIKAMGCEPVLAEDGEGALELVKQYDFRLVLTDISMPGIDGYELCRIMKRNERTKDIPIVFISAFDNPQDIVEGFRLGGADYITKPFIPEVVQARVGVHLHLREASLGLMEMNRRLQVSVSEQLRQMEQEKKNILIALANIAAQNAGYEREFTKRLCHNCRILAQGMQLSPLFESKISDTYIDAIEVAAPLCDIGKVGISKELLQKEAGLTEEETAIVQSHTDIGAKFLRDLYVNSDYNDFISISVDIVQSHHENWNGTGYPKGLKGEEIPLAAQIISVMEMYCTLTRDGACNREEALEIMRKEAGVRFNSDIFKICEKISRQLI